MSIQRWLERRWYYGPPPLLLRPLAPLYRLLAARRARRMRREAASVSLPVPVVVVGNLSVGGTGKTPFVIWLVERLREWGFAPGIVSRGYGGKGGGQTLRVDAGSDPARVGDEPLLLAQRLGVPVAVGVDRLAAAAELLRDPRIDILIADDGLQHYRLPRQLEICVVDGRRGFGNGHLLPAGPLREPVSRLAAVDLVVVNGGRFRPEHGLVAPMQLQVSAALPLAGGAPKPLSEFAGRRVHAVAGIGDPVRFFAALSAVGIEVVMHPFPDHHAFRARDLAFDGETPVLMTEKDAVKCRRYAQPHHWYVPANAELSPESQWTVQKLLHRLRDQWSGRARPAHNG